MSYNDEAITALARLRQYAQQYGSGPVGVPAEAMARLFRTLDNAGVFAALDEQTDYAPAVGILAEAAAKAVEDELGKLNPAEWGDTRRTPVGEPLYGAEAERMRERIKSDALRSQVLRNGEWRMP